MTVWDDLQGQSAVVTQLQQAAMGDGLTHAWLFTGPPGSGRSNAAKAFAAALNCDQDDVSRRGCGECHACRTILGETHADVVSSGVNPTLVPRDREAPERTRRERSA